MGPQTRPGHIYVVNVDTVNSGIPYADSFHVVLYWCLATEGPWKTRLAVNADIKFKKNVWAITKSEIHLGPSLHLLIDLVL